MIEPQEFCQHVHIEVTTLETWVEAGWIVPSEDDGNRGYSEADLARARLIQDLRLNFGVNDEGVDLILDLVDQIHGLRRALSDVLAAREK
jgi:chaperone modulatory protein CbpM